MKRVLLMLLCIPLLLGAAPSRTKTYVAGTIIENEDVTENEDNIFSYLQAGVDTHRANSVTSTAILDGTITNADLGSNSVTSASITDGTIVSADIADGTIVAGDLADDAVTEAKLKAVDSPADEEFLTYESTTGDFEWQAITDPVADRVHRTAGDVTTTSATLADMTGMSITLTTGANPVLVGFYGGCVSNDATTGFVMNVDVDGALALGTQGVTFDQHATINDQSNCSFTIMTADLTAASHTFKIQIARLTAGTATWSCNSTSACGMWVQEVTD